MLASSLEAGARASNAACSHVGRACGALHPRMDRLYETSGNWLSRGGRRGQLRGFCRPSTAPKRSDRRSRAHAGGTGGLHPRASARRGQHSHLVCTTFSYLGEVCLPGCDRALQQRVWRAMMLSSPRLPFPTRVGAQLFRGTFRFAFHNGCKLPGSAARPPARPHDSNHPLIECPALRRSTC